MARTFTDFQHVLIILALLLGGLFSIPAIGDDKIEPTYNQEAFQKLMQRKEAAVKAIHEGLLAKDYAAVTRNLDELSAVAQDATWRMIRTDGYHKHSAAFQQTIKDMATAVKTGDRDAMLGPYSSLNLACSSCHESVRSKIKR